MLLLFSVISVYFILDLAFTFSTEIKKSTNLIYIKASTLQLLTYRSQEQIRRNVVSNTMDISVIIRFKTNIFYYLAKLKSIAKKYFLYFKFHVKGSFWVHYPPTIPNTPFNGIIVCFQNGHTRCCFTHCNQSSSKSYFFTRI